MTSPKGTVEPLSFGEEGGAGGQDRVAVDL